MADPVPVPFGVWRPDAADRQADANEARGCVRRAGAYGPFLSPQVLDPDGVLDGTALGAATFIYNSVAETFAGDAAKLYRLVSGAFDDVSKMGGYTVTADDTWQFEQFGAFIVAAAVGEAVQSYQIGTSTDFANLDVSTPALTSLWRFGDFLMGGAGSTVHWSAFNDISDWTPDPGTQAGNQALDAAGGDVLGGSAGEYGAIFQEHHIRRCTYVGGAVIFDFEQDAIEKRRGILSRNAFVRLGRLNFYASEQGFFIFDGQQSIPIGENKVDEYFHGRLNYGSRGKVFAAYDSLQKAVVFGFPAGDAEMVSELLIFSLTDREWTHDELEVECLLEVVAPGYTVETVDDFFGTTDLDSVTELSIDAPVLKGGGRSLGCFDTAHTLATFAGAPRPVILDTIEAELAPGRRSLITELWPTVDVADRAGVSTRLGSRVLPGDDVVFTDPSGMNAYGFCPHLIDSRFHRARLAIAGGASWTRAEGIAFLGQPTGRR